MSKKVWMFNPQAGGAAIPKSIQPQVTRRILEHAEQHYAGRYNRIEVRYRGQFCYINAYLEPWVPDDFDARLFGQTREERIEDLRNFPTHLCRLRYFSDVNRFSMAFYTYSHEKYEACLFPGGSWQGTPEAAFDVSAVYLS
jgi:hypothetical protein